MPYRAPMDGFDISAALLHGRTLPVAKLRTIDRHGDSADELYLILYETLSGSSRVRNLRRALLNTSPRYIAEAWLPIVAYAKHPSQSNLRKLMKAIRAPEQSSGIIMRLSTISIVGRHRRLFAATLKQTSSGNPFIQDDLSDVLSDLVDHTGPLHLVARRERQQRCSPLNVR